MKQTTVIRIQITDLEKQIEKETNWLMRQAMRAEKKTLMLRLNKAKQLE